MTTRSAIICLFFALALVAAYWLTRPPERLAVRIVDAGPYSLNTVRILWGPRVPDAAECAESKLDIYDGEDHFATSLSTQEFRNGTFIYRRHSEHVSVHLSAIRVGVGTIEEEDADFTAPLEPTPMQSQPTRN